MREATYLREQARECRSAARKAQDRRDSQALMQLARYYEERAAQLDPDKAAALH